MQAPSGAESVGLKPLQPSSPTAYATTAEESSPQEGNRDPEEGVVGQCHIKECWLYLSHRARPVGGGRRGRPNNEKYKGRRPKRDHSFWTMPTVPNSVLRR